MEFKILQSAKALGDVLSGILNWVCPECGGRMGGHGKEFKCQGRCQTDWRQVWDSISSTRSFGRSERAIRPI
jgi:tRNA(Ile2) C34 agmatinyltransferase TiaS